MYRQRPDGRCAPCRGYQEPLTLSPAPSASAERRQLTVMFCDLVGSTALAARLDPEDLREIIAAYRDGVVAIVRKYGGTISRYIGDGMLILFGHPSAHEDDAERAVRAAIEIAAAGHAPGAPPGLELRVRTRARNRPRHHRRSDRQRSSGGAGGAR